jgi:hypothetical protein
MAKQDLGHELAEMIFPLPFEFSDTEFLPQNLFDVNSEPYELSVQWELEE